MSEMNMNEITKCSIIDGTCTIVKMLYYTIYLPATVVVINNALMNTSPTCIVKIIEVKTNIQADNLMLVNPRYTND